MKYKIFLFILLITSFGIAQNSKFLINEANTCILNGDEKCLDNILDKLWITYLKEQIPYYKNAIKFIDEKEYDKAFNNIDSLILEDYLVEQIPLDEKLKNLDKEHRWEKTLTKLNNSQKSYNSKLRTTLLKLGYRDQGIRLILINARQSKNQNNELLKKIRVKMKEIDNESAEAISSIIDKYGWLGTDKVGQRGNEYLFLGIQHVDNLKVQNKYLPLLKDAVKKNNAEPWHYAYLTDRILMNQGKKQIYGTQTIISKNPENSYVVPLKDPDKVDELRKSVGLEPIKEYLEGLGIEWDLETYKKDLPKIERLYKERSKNNKN